MSLTEKMKIMKMLALGSAAVTLAACGQPATTATPPSTSQPLPAPSPIISSPPTTVPASSTKTTETEFGRQVVYTIDRNEAHGYSQRVVLAWGPPVRADDPGVPTEPSDSGCSYTPQKDLVVPFSAVISNTTKQEPSAYKVSMVLSTAGDDGLQFAGFIDYGANGSRCEPQMARGGYSDGPPPVISTSSSNELPAGQSIRSTGMFIFKDFFSPAGNQEDGLKQTFLELGEKYSEDSYGSGVVGITGGPLGLGKPRQIVYQPTSDYVAPIDGKTSPCGKEANKSAFSGHELKCQP